MQLSSSGMSATNTPSSSLQWDDAMRIGLADDACLAELGDRFGGAAEFLEEGVGVLA